MRATIEPRPGPGLEALDVEVGAVEERLEQVGVAGLAARVGCAVVDALVADQRLQELDGLAGVIEAGVIDATSRRACGQR